jgi:hypothetical protein
MRRSARLTVRTRVVVLSATLLLVAAGCAEGSVSQYPNIAGAIRHAPGHGAVLLAFSHPNGDSAPQMNLEVRAVAPNLAADGLTVVNEVAAATAVPPPVDTRVAAVGRLLTGRPLEPYADEMVAAADNAGIDWRLLPTIAMLESGAGVSACGNNAYGYAACAQDFASPESAITQVAATLAGGPYTGLPPLSKLCVWVGGTVCTTEHELAYRDRAAGLFANLDSLRAG